MSTLEAAYVHRAPRARPSTLRGAAIVASLAMLVAGAPTPAAGAPSAGRQSARVFVAVDGHRSAAGTREDPLASIDQAVRRLGRGGTVVLRGGTYAQRVHLGDTRGITIRPARGEHAILDGGPLTAPEGRSAMVTIVDSSDITIAGLDVRGYDTTRLAATPIGIYVHGASKHVTLRGNHVHSLGNYNGTLGSYDLNAHGIAVYGDRATHPITDLTITGNEVDHLALGASESVVVNGNVNHWRIVRNNIHDNNNIGIDAIGYESTLGGADRYTRANRARNGVIADNVVTNIISRGNPAYYEDGSWCNCADGIYVDGGTSIRVLRNTLRGNDIGLEVAAENPRGKADHVTAADNFISDSGYVGIATGGYCNGADDCGGERTGSAYANAFVNNTLYANNRFADGSPELLVQYYTYRTTIRNNIIFATGAPDVIGTVPDADRDGLSRPSRLDGNLYYTEPGEKRTATFGLLGRTYTGWRAYRAATGADPHSRFTDPRLRRPSTGNLHLERRSPAVDRGLRVAPSTVGRLDIDHDPRLLGGRIDIGADERR